MNLMDFLNICGYGFLYPFSVQQDTYATTSTEKTQLQITQSEHPLIIILRFHPCHGLDGT